MKIPVKFDPPTGDSPIRDAYVAGYDAGFGRAALFALFVGVLVIFALVLTGCDTGTGERIAPTRNSAAPGSTIQLPAVEWRIRRPEEIAHAWANSTGKVVCRQGTVNAFIGRDPTTGRPVAYTTAPIYVDDDVARALGHELMHEAFGDYHRAAPIADHKDECR